MISVLSKVFYQRSVIDKSYTGQYPRCSSVLVNGKIYKCIQPIPQTCPVIFAFLLVVTVRFSPPQG